MHAFVKKNKVNKTLELNVQTEEAKEEGVPGRLRRREDQRFQQPITRRDKG